MSFSVVGRHTLSDIRPRFDMPLQEAAADLGISVNSLKRICRKFGIPKWPYRQRFSLLKHKKKLEDAMESSPAEDLPTLQLHFEHVSNILRELDERGCTDPAHLSSFSEHDLGSPLSSEVLDEDSSSVFTKGVADASRRAFGKRRFSSSSSLSSETHQADTVVSPAKRLAKATATTMRGESKLVGVTNGTPGKAECSSLELLAQIAAQQTTPPPEDVESKESFLADRSATPAATVGRAYREPLPPDAPISAASDAMLSNMVYTAQQNVHQLARRVHALESSLYYFMAMMHQHQHQHQHQHPRSQQQQQFQQSPPLHQQHNQPPQQPRKDQCPPTSPSLATETTT